MGSFESVNHHTEHQAQKNVEEDENITDIAVESPFTRTSRISASMFHA
jgi:AraC-like DNA-binding protein